MRPRRWTDEQLREAVEGCRSMMQVMRLLGLSYSGNAKKRLDAHIERLGLDTSHWVSHGNQTYAIPLDVILVENSTYIGHNQRIKRRLIESGLMIDECVKCGQGPIWNGLPIVLTLDHINGVSNDHRIENLRILCPNCHSQTETFSGRNNKTLDVDLAFKVPEEKE